MQKPKIRERTPGAVRTIGPRWARVYVLVTVIGKRSALVLCTNRGYDNLLSIAEEHGLAIYTWGRNDVELVLATDKQALYDHAIREEGERGDS